MPRLSHDPDSIILTANMPTFNKRRLIAAEFDSDDDTPSVPPPASKPSKRGKKMIQDILLNKEEDTASADEAFLDQTFVARSPWMQLFVDTWTEIFEAFLETQKGPKYIPSFLRKFLPLTVW